MDFDDYFARFRCYSPECGWMAASSTEREIHRLRERQALELLGSTEIEALELTLTVKYDRANDALLVDFGIKEPTFDLPDGDGRMFWKIGKRNGCVAGFTIVGARELGCAGLRINIEARKKTIEDRLKGLTQMPARNRATRTLIENVVVTAETADSSDDSTGGGTPIGQAVDDAIKRLEEEHASTHATQPRDAMTSST